MITQKRLKELLVYDPETGVFIHKTSRGGQSIGGVAGTLSNVDGYIRIKLETKAYLAHRLAFVYVEGEAPEEADHRNRIRSDNAWKNLKPSSRRKNSLNKGLNKNNKSGKCGVYPYESKTKGTRYVASIGIKGKQKVLGTFDTKARAVKARKEAEKKCGFSASHGKRTHI